MADTSPEDVWAAVKTVWDVATTLTGLNGPFRDRKPAGLDPGIPYIIFRAGDATPFRYTSSSEYEQYSFQFDIYDRTPEACGAAFGLIGSVFDPVRLTLGTGKGNQVLLRRGMASDDGERTVDKTLAMQTLSYEFTRRVPKRSGAS